VSDIRNIRTSDVEIDKTTDKMMMVSGILKRGTIYGTKTSVNLHRSAHRAVISKTDMVKKIMNALSLGEVVDVRCGYDLYPKKVNKTSHNKVNIVKIIPVMSISSP
jgi:hypothetical protein